MIPEFIKKFILSHLRKDGYLNCALAKKQATSEMNEWLASKDGWTWTTVYWLIKYNLDDIPKCPNCGNPIKNFYGAGKKTFCSYKCSVNSEITKEKMRKTNLEKYGVSCVFSSPEVREKYKKTMLERYGVDSPLKNKEILEKTYATMKEHYGVEHALQSAEVQEKFKKTSLERFGTEHPWMSEEVKQTIVDTTLERYGVRSTNQLESVKQKKKETTLLHYGVEYPMLSPEILQKARNTIFEKYGVFNALQSEEVKQKVANTCLERYGSVSPLANSEIKQKMEQTNLERYGAKCVLSSKEVRKQIQRTKKEIYFPTAVQKLQSKFIEIDMSKDDYINSDEYKYICTKCNTHFVSNETNPIRVICPQCKMYHTTSREEKHFLNWLREIYNGPIIENAKKIIQRKELDIYLPELNLAFEYNGAYWHSDEYMEPSYHVDKTNACKEQGIRLIHIFDWEWHNSQDIVKDIILTALGNISRQIPARKCKLGKISFSDYTNFLELNHIQGPINSSVRYGLFYEGELVSVAGWGKSRFKKDEMELHRFCSKLGTQIIGGFSKLIKHSGLDEFVSYIDRAKFDGRGYMAAGFEVIGDSEPSYIYTRGNTILSRFQCQKHKLPTLLGESFDEKKTEYENMIDNGYKRVYDCGTTKVLWRKK